MSRKERDGFVAFESLRARYGTLDSIIQEKDTPTTDDIESWLLEIGEMKGEIKRILNEDTLDSDLQGRLEAYSGFLDEKSDRLLRDPEDTSEVHLGELLEDLEEDVSSVQEDSAKAPKTTAKKSSPKSVPKKEKFPAIAVAVFPLFGVYNLVVMAQEKLAESRMKKARQPRPVTATTEEVLELKTAKTKNEKIKETPRQRSRQNIREKKSARISLDPSKEPLKWKKEASITIASMHKVLKNLKDEINIVKDKPEHAKGLTNKVIDAHHKIVRLGRDLDNDDPSQLTELRNAHDELKDLQTQAKQQLKSIENRIANEEDSLASYTGDDTSYESKQILDDSVEKPSVDVESSDSKDPVLADLMPLLEGDEESSIESKSDVIGEDKSVDEDIPALIGPNENEPSQDLADTLQRLQKICIEKDYGLSERRSGNKYHVKNNGETLTVTPQENGGLELQGSSKLSTEILSGWSEDLGCEKTEIKIQFKGIDDSINPTEGKGPAAWEKFQDFTSKGFLVQDFPIVNFKDQENYADMKEKYDDLKDEAGAEKSGGLSM